MQSTDLSLADGKLTKRTLHTANQYLHKLLTKIQSKMLCLQLKMNDCWFINERIVFRWQYSHSFVLTMKMTV